MADTRIFDGLKCEGGVPYAALGITCPKCGAEDDEPCVYAGSDPPPLSGEGAVGTPIDIILFCPRCGLQHIDAPDERTPDWTNPPHKSHLCHGCGFVFRPADVPTNGVADIKTIGANDGPRYRNRATIPAPEVTGGCYDCKRPYGNENGFPDLIIPNDAWGRISPSGNLGGLLCPSCVCKRLHDAKITCEGAFMSGPIESVSRPTMYALRRVENAERRLNELESTLRTGEDG